MGVDNTKRFSSPQTPPTQSTPEQVTSRSTRLLPVWAFSLPLSLTLILLGFGLFESVSRHPGLLWSFTGAGIALLVWIAVLLGSSLSTGRVLAIEFVLRKQHYVQACAQAAVLLYWAWYWPQLYESTHLIAAQLVFAYAFDMLLSWSLRDTYTAGFGPFPVVLSINLFLLFKEDWFYLQLMMVALGFAAKDLISWNKEGRRAHVFNPSSFPLAIFSLALILTDMTDVTWGREIAITQFYPPQMYLILFLVSLPGQYFFGVTTMTMTAAVTTYVFGLLYFAVTGTYYFFDSYIPIAVFLGMHLLFTDPSTAPRTELGRIIFGVGYGLSTVLLYKVLAEVGVPTFYDKLLPVPILNLSVRAIDRTARSTVLRRLDPAALCPFLTPRRRKLVYVSVWVAVFAVMSGAQGVGDSHPGQWVPFWQQACNDDRPYACSYLAEMQSKFCNAGSGWACNEFGVLQTELYIDGPGPRESLKAGCQLGFVHACVNGRRLNSGVNLLVRAPPTLEDYPIVLRGSKAPITDLTPADLHTRACDQGWPHECGRTGAGPDP